LGLLGLGLFCVCLVGGVADSLLARSRVRLFVSADLRFCPLFFASVLACVVVCMCVCLLLFGRARWGEGRAGALFFSLFECCQSAQKLFATVANLNVPAR
jgi:hypothetical protein